MWNELFYSLDSPQQHLRHLIISRLNPLRSTLPRTTYPRHHSLLRAMRHRSLQQIDILQRHRRMWLQHTITVHTVNRVPFLSIRQLMERHRMQHRKRTTLRLHQSLRFSQQFLLLQRSQSRQRGPKCPMHMTHRCCRRSHGRPHVPPRRRHTVHMGSTALTSLLLPHRPSPRAHLQGPLLRRHLREQLHLWPGRLLHRA